MFKRLRKRRAQSTLEYAVLIVIVIGALLTIQTYVKRGIQGRLRQATDDIGDQFDTEINMTRKTVFHTKTKETYKVGVLNSILIDAETTNVTYNMSYTGGNMDWTYWGK